MPVDVRLPTVLRQHAGGMASVKANGTTLAEVFDDLVRQFPGLAGQVVTDNGTLHKFVNVYVNDDDVRYLDKLETKVSDDDVVSILPAVAGGALATN
ncbi:MAG: MoaD/ThiS family protein [Actinomycetota bacterium]|jgi:molybdopterin synthase sulfur carrier subunit|nr:MoaD/ThiS family protein [Actinomycetota bacterium]PLS76461.1 MAG: MoaD/ThiS family protein [Actinomycetota bacterium]